MTETAAPVRLPDLPKRTDDELLQLVIGADLYLVMVRTTADGEGPCVVEAYSGERRLGLLGNYANQGLATKSLWIAADAARVLFADHVHEGA